MSLAALRRFTRPIPAPAAGVSGAGAERCDLCGAALGSRHGHVVELDQRSLRCACRACYLLFTHEGAGGRRFRAVPERYLHDPAQRLTDADWDALQVPVTPVFLFTNSDLGRVVACYPSPAGVVECLPDLDAWARLRRTCPLLAVPAPDVEAVFVARTGGGLEAFCVPIDACYALAGEVRLRWRGFDGGDAVRRTLAEFVDGLRARSRSTKAPEV